MVKNPFPKGTLGCYINLHYHFVFSHLSLYSLSQDWLRKKCSLITQVLCNADVWLLWIIVQFKFNDCQLALLIAYICNNSISGFVISSVYTFLKETPVFRIFLSKNSRCLLKRLQISCLFIFSRLSLACFQDSRWLVCPVSIKVIWRGSRTSKSADRVLPHWVVSF